MSADARSKLTTIKKLKLLTYRHQVSMLAKRFRWAESFRSSPRSRFLQLRLVCRSQHGDVVAAPSRLVVDITLRRGAARGPTIGDATTSAAASARILCSLLVFGDNDDRDDDNDNRVAEASEDNDKNEAEYRDACDRQIATRWRPLVVANSRFMSIGAQPSFVNDSHEFLRWSYERESASMETLHATTNEDGDCTIAWTPTIAGCYEASAILDSHAIAARLMIVVRPPPSLVESRAQPPPATPVHRARRLVAAVESSSSPQPPQSPIAVAHVPTVSSYAGARLRSLPTLVASVVGIAARGATIRFVETTTNADGRWLRLAAESRSRFCERQFANQQAWVLQHDNRLEVGFCCFRVEC